MSKAMIVGGWTRMAAVVARRVGLGGLVLCAMMAAGMAGSADSYKATVTFLKGMARHQGKGGAIANVTLGQALLEGETILTLQNTKCELKLENGTVIRLGPSTKFTLATLQRTPMGGVKGVFKVVSGRLWFTVAKLTGDSEMTTQTPSVVAAVKGTVYRVDAAADGKTDLAVYDGVVAASQPGQAPVDVHPMEQLAAMPNSAFERGTVDESQDDKDDWIKWNKNRDKLRVMIIIPEKHGEERVSSSVSENAAMKRFLNNYLFKLVEKDQADKIRDGEKLKAALKGDTAAAAAAGLEVAADLIIVGEARASYFKSPVLGGLISATANLTGRAVRADTAEVIAALPGLSTRAVDITDESAASKALMAAGEKMASEFIDSIIAGWKRDARKGTGLNVIVDGVDYKKLKILTNVLAGIEGVRDVQSLYLVGRRSLLSITFAGDSTGLADRIEAANFAPLKVGVVGLSAYKLELEVTGGGAMAPAPAPAAASPKAEAGAEESAPEGAAPQAPVTPAATPAQ
ncbi:MAG: FecR family protein [Candidatus Coatesbacteria bacterium]